MPVIKCGVGFCANDVDGKCNAGSVEISGAMTCGSFTKSKKQADPYWPTNIKEEKQDEYSPET